MISRRNIRIKAMQSVYALLQSTDDWNVKEGTKLLVNNYAEACELSVAYLYIAKGICDYAITDASNRASKRLPTAADLAVNTKMSKNTTVASLAANPHFEGACLMYKLDNKIDPDFIKRLYTYVVASEEYTQYISSAHQDEKQDEVFFLYLINILCTVEDFHSTVEEIYGHWLDDSTMVQAWIQKNFNKLPKTNFTDLLSKEKKDFGIELLATFFDRYSFTSELIKPKLLNWDSDRIAMMDMIIMQMGLTEILYFENIPCKVSINEYIDIAKNYSTMQSGQFVNGVLDKLYKELEKDNKIHKKAFSKN
jgi:transcription antitermination protein NusB